MSKSADSLARESAEEAIQVIRDEMRNPLNEAKDRLKAAEMLLERGHGKPTQAIIAIPASKRVSEAAAQMTDEDLLEVMRASPLPRLQAPDNPTSADGSATARGAVAEAVDVEFEEVDPLLR